MLTIRLQRIGRRNDPSFRVVAIDKRRGPRSARSVELLGSHNPKQHTTTLKAERIRYWIGEGAQTSGTVHNLLVSEGIITGKKVNVLPRKRPVVKEATAEDTAKEITVETEESAEEAAAPEETETTEPTEATEKEATD